jgi:chromate transport protein ChrA
MSQRILTLVAVAVLALLLTWGLATNRWRRGRPAVIAVSIVAALLLLTRRVSILELLLVLSLPVALLVIGGRRRGSPGRRGRR